MEYYLKGQKYIDDVVVPGITVIGDIEVAIATNAPEPFVYGVKKICIDKNITLDDNGDVKNTTCTIYDVINGVYLVDQIFPGDDWLEAVPTYTELKPQMDSDAIISLDNLGSILELRKQTIGV